MLPEVCPALKELYNKLGAFTYVCLWWSKSLSYFDQKVLLLINGKRNSWLCLRLYRYQVVIGKTVIKQSDASEGFLDALGWPPDDLLTGEELIAVDEDAGDVAEEKDENDADEDRSQVDLLLHRGSCPRVRQPGD